MLYRGMDRTQLDAAYNNLAAVPSSAKLLAEWAARSSCFMSDITGTLASRTANGRVRGSTFSLPQ